MARYSTSSTIAYWEQRGKCDSCSVLSGFNEAIVLVKKGSVNNKGAYCWTESY